MCNLYTAVRQEPLEISKFIPLALFIYFIAQILDRTRLEMVDFILSFCFSFLQFPPIMIPVLDSVDAISCTCEKVLTDMTCEPITGEHYNVLEVQLIKTLCIFYFILFFTGTRKMSAKSQMTAEIY